MAQNVDDKFLSAFADLMINKIKSISDDWQQPWINTSGIVGLPQNLDGRKYRGINSLLLYMTSEENKYKLPVYTTFNQAKQNDLKILKGSTSVPILYWNYLVKDRNTGAKITIDDYRNLSKEEQKKYITIPYMRHYNVFNVEQTNIKEVKPELWDKLEKKFLVHPRKDDKGMFVCQPIDNMIKDRSWVVPIEVKEQDAAFYSMSKDNERIVVPLKKQFKDGESFYSTLLHEMAHSTGHPDRLNRDMTGRFGNKEYGKEELIAELTSAVTGQSIGISTSIREENAQYLKGWLASIKEKPDFLLQTITDVNKASNMVLDVVEKEQIKIDKDIEETIAELKKGGSFFNKVDNVEVFRHYTGEYAIRCNIDGKPQTAEVLSYSEQKAFFEQKSITEKELAITKYESVLNDSPAMAIKR